VRRTLGAVPCSARRGAQVEARILAGPQRDLGNFLRALQRLETAITFLSQHRCLLGALVTAAPARHPAPCLPCIGVTAPHGARSLATAEGALSSATALRADALRLALEDFTATLRQHSSGAAAPMIAAGSESATSSPSRGGRETPQAGAHPARAPGRRQRVAAAAAPRASADARARRQGRRRATRRLRRCCPA